MLRGDTATTAFQGYWPSLRPVQARTRVSGSDLAPEAASGWSCSSSPRTPSGSTCTYGRTASGRPIVTNLRLPGQYDERLLGSVGLQGCPSRKPLSARCQSGRAEKAENRD
jgi:hypothetical protein